VRSIKSLFIIYFRYRPSTYDACPTGAEGGNANTLSN
jgi:hypothetical protein